MASAATWWRRAFLLVACVAVPFVLPAGGAGRPVPPRGPAPATGAPSAPAPVPPAPVRSGPVRVSGELVAGGAGGMGSRVDPFSEVLRRPDGSCVGWAGTVSDGWTGDLVPGAGFVLLDPGSGAVLGAGLLGAGRWQDVDALPGRAQWQCAFGFEAVARSGLQWYEIQVGGLPPWPLVPDPTAPGRFAGSVNLPVLRADFPACVPGAAAGWSVVGAYWSQGVHGLCAAGLTVTGIRRGCRPGGVASDHVIAVLDPADPSRVYEDARGRLPATPAAGGTTELLVAGGVPCG